MIWFRDFVICILLQNVAFQSLREALISGDLNLGK